jgi:serine protease SohB
LFSGEYWTGVRGLELGLVDAIGDMRGVLRERFGDKVVTPLISAERGWFGRRVAGVGGGIGGGQQMLQEGLAEAVISALEARAIWARFGF